MHVLDDRLIGLTLRYIKQFKKLFFGLEYSYPITKTIIENQNYDEELIV